MPLIAKKGKNVIRQSDIIQAILDADARTVSAIMATEPEAVNSLHEPSGMNAIMLAVSGRLDEIVDILANSAINYVDFGHYDHNGNNLLSVSLGTLNREMVDKIQSFYEAHALHLINNWPEP